MQVVEYALQARSDINVSLYLDDYRVAEISEHYELRQSGLERAVLFEQRSPGAAGFDKLSEISVGIEQRFIKRLQSHHAAVDAEFHFERRVESYRIDGMRGQVVRGLRQQQYVARISFEVKFEAVYAESEIEHLARRSVAVFRILRGRLEIDTEHKAVEFRGEEYLQQQSAEDTQVVHLEGS